MVRLDAAIERIGEQDREIDQQHELIEKKETFGAAMLGLTETMAQLDGVLLESVVPFESYELTALRAWHHRGDPAALDRDIASVNTAIEDLKGLLAAASAELATNVTGTTYEAVIDRKLDHRIFVNRYEYWDISVGYGYTCNEAQKHAVRAWYDELGFHNRPISQER